MIEDPSDVLANVSAEFLQYQYQVFGIADFLPGPKLQKYASINQGICTWKQHRAGKK